MAWRYTAEPSRDYQSPVLNIIIMCQKIPACVLVESMSIREDKKDIWKFILFVRATKG